ncbi:hypothetical protein M1145_01350 [Patescibacteria group bacterium]|nr:hypothetical protein [Patescibacteria group bacterium]
MKKNKTIYGIILSIFVIVLAIVIGSYIRDSFAQGVSTGPIQQYEIQSQGMYNGTQRTVILYQQALPSILSMFQYSLYNGAQSSGSFGSLTYSSSNTTLCSFFYLNPSLPFWSSNNPNSCD